METQNNSEEEGEVIENIFQDIYFGDDGNKEPTGSMDSTMMIKS